MQKAMNAVPKCCICLDICLFAQSSPWNFNSSCFLALLAKLSWTQCDTLEWGKRRIPIQKAYKYVLAAKLAFIVNDGQCFSLLVQFLHKDSSKIKKSICNFFPFSRETRRTAFLDFYLVVIRSLKHHIQTSVKMKQLLGIRFRHI